MHRPPAVFVSPHPDDICLSMGGTVSHLLVRGHVLTVFGDSKWADPSWKGPRDRAAIAAARAAEDAAYCATLGFSVSQMHLPDSSLRQSRWNRATLPGGSNRLLRSHAERAIRRLCDRVRAQIIVGPLGLGHHPDHVICRQALLRAASSRIPLLLYEDLPYVSSMPLPQFDAEVRAIDERLRPVLCYSELSRARKFAAFSAAYPSQNDAEMLDQAASHSVRLAQLYGRVGADAELAYERLWTTLTPEELRARFDTGTQLDFAPAD